MPTEIDVTLSSYRGTEKWFAVQNYRQDRFVLVP